jgi:hypothetical protein
MHYISRAAWSEIHTGMGKERPFDADDSIENLNMINKVIEMLNINLVK